MKRPSEKIGRCCVLPIFILALLLIPNYTNAQETFAQRISLIPALLKVHKQHPDSLHIRIVSTATCFALSVKFEATNVTWFIVSNYHPLVLKDSSGNIIAEVDSAKVFRNATDTVIELRAKVLAKNPHLDLALLEITDEIPFEKGVHTIGIEIDLNKDTEPIIGEKVVYSGFPKLLGQDTTLKQNYPLVIEGIVSQNRPDKPDFIVQAPIFSGASGSPILSLTDGRFLGVVYGKVPEQESFLYAIRANAISVWIRRVLVETIIPKMLQKN